MNKNLLPVAAIAVLSAFVSAARGETWTPFPSPYRNYHRETVIEGLVLGGPWLGAAPIVSVTCQIGQPTPKIEEFVGECITLDAEDYPVYRNFDKLIDDDALLALGADRPNLYYWRRAAVNIAYDKTVSLALRGALELERRASKTIAPSDAARGMAFLRRERLLTEAIEATEKFLEAALESCRGLEAEVGVSAKNICGRLSDDIASARYRVSCGYRTTYPVGVLETAGGVETRTSLLPNLPPDEMCELQTRLMLVTPR